MFHVELRQFPHQARAFNLTREELDARILEPLAAGRAVELEDRRWSPEKLKLTVYEGRALEPGEIGMGRGWGTVTQTGRDVTDRLLGEARGAAGPPAGLEKLKAAIVASCADAPLTLARVLDLAGDLRSDLSATARVEVAARAIWELLQEERLTLAARD